MDRVLVDVPFAYTASRISPLTGKPEDIWFRATARGAIPSLSADEASLAFDVKYNQPFRMSHAKGRIYDNRLYRPAHRHETLTLERLSAFAENPQSAAGFTPDLKVNVFEFALPRPVTTHMLVPRLDALTTRRRHEARFPDDTILSSTEDSMRASVEKQIPDMLLAVDGEIWTTRNAEEPYWYVLASAGYVELHCGARQFASGESRFRLDCRSEARAYANEWADKLGIPVWESSDEVLFVDPDRLTNNHRDMIAGQIAALAGTLLTTGHFQIEPELDNGLMAVASGEETTPAGIIARAMHWTRTRQASLPPDFVAYGNSAFSILTTCLDRLEKTALAEDPALRRAIDQTLDTLEAERAGAGLDL